MADQDDVLHLIDDTEPEPRSSTARKWKIAVIDDDHAVHEGTRFALSDYTLNDQTLEILSAYSAAEGRELMRQHTDIAAVLLDVIMEAGKTKYAIEIPKLGSLILKHSLDAPLPGLDTVPR